MHIGVYIVRNAKKCARTSNATHNMHHEKCPSDQSTNDNSSTMFNRHQCSTYTIMTVQYRTARYFAIGTATVRLVRKARDWTRAQRLSPSSPWLVFFIWYRIVSVFFLLLVLASVDACPTSVSVGRQWQVTELPQLFRMNVR